MEVKKVSELQEIADVQQAVIPCVDGEGNAKKVPASKLGISTIKAGTGENAEVFNGIASSNASGVSSHAEGMMTGASNTASHAEGSSTTASGDSSHAEGHSTKATGESSHAEGHTTTASGVSSHAEGYSTTAIGESSHAEGKNTKTSNLAEHAEGKYNKSNSGTISSIGIGSSNSDRKNAFEVMDNGDIYVYGLGGYDGTNAGTSGIKTLQQILTNS